MATVDSRGRIRILPVRDRRKSRERSNDWKHRNGRGTRKLCPRGGRSCRYSSASTPSFTGTRALMQSIQGAERSSTHRDREHGREGFLAKFEARRASESVLRVPGQSSGCALTARNPAAFSPSPSVSVARQRRQEADPCLKELQWDCAVEIRVSPTAISLRQIFLSNVARSRRD